MRGDGTSQPEAQVRERGVKIVETLYREGEPLTTQELAEKLGTTRKKVARAVQSTPAADLLEVVKGMGKPNQYSLASLRDEAEES